MRKAVIMMMAVALIAIGGSVFAGEGEATTKWFDMEGCDMCKPLAQTEGLMQNMTWETYPISNGIVSVSTVPKEYAPAYKKAHEAMSANWAKMMGGEKMHLCGMCQAMKATFNETVKMENVQTMGGELSLTTSTDPATVTKLHNIADRNAKEMAMMMKEGGGHEGHDMK